MTRRERLIARIRARPPEAEFEDVRALMEEFGWHLRRERGSHATFKKPGVGSITIPKRGGRKVIRVYLDQVCELLGLDIMDGD